MKIIKIVLTLTLSVFVTGITLSASNFGLERSVNSIDCKKNTLEYIPEKLFRVKVEKKEDYFGHKKIELNDNLQILINPEDYNSSHAKRFVAQSINDFNKEDDKLEFVDKKNNGVVSDSGPVVKGITLNPSMRPWNFVGLNPNSWFCTDDNKRQKIINQDVKYLKDLGITYVRIEFPWWQIETSKGTFDWSITDYIVEQCNAQGLSLVPQLVYCPGWVASSPINPPNSMDFGNFVTAIVNRYKPSIHIWEMWNEPDVIGSTGLNKYYSGNATSYVKNVLIPGYNAAKAADPTCTVSLAGLGRGTTNYLSQCYSAGAQPYYDIVGYHLYTSNPNAMISLGQSFRSLMNSNGDSEKQLWMSEFGAEQNSIHDSITQNLLTVVNNSGAPTIDVALYYELRDDYVYSSSTVVKHVEYLGIMQSNYIKKDSYSTLKEIEGVIPTPTPTFTPSSTTINKQVGNYSSNSKKVATNLMEASWKLDATGILSRGDQNAFDSDVVGDPCVIWDEDIKTWRMYYFAMGKDSLGIPGVTTGMAISKSGEEIGPGDWEKTGKIKITNPNALMDRHGQHKFWVIMDPYKFNTAAKIKNKYWAIFTCSTPTKYLQVASALKIGGPWQVREKPILSPDENFLDGMHCDTPTAYWFEDKNVVTIFYKGYPKYSQKTVQPASPFGSGTILAYWNVDDSVATKIAVLQRPGQSKAWNQGWMSTPMIFYDQEKKQWYGLINGSPTPPVDKSHREPAPSIGGWVICTGKWLNSDWVPDTLHSPFRYPEDLSKDEKQSGLGVNFWRHHLLVTPGGKARIFFNSGQYGHEQMYSLVKTNY